MRLLLVGDVMLGRVVNEALRTLPPEFVWGDTLPLFRAADVRICNLECVLADGGAPWRQTPKAFHFRSDARNVAVLQAAGINAVSLANNHTLDYGYDALEEMLENLDRAGIARAGAGLTAAAARRPAILSAPGGRVGLLAFTDNEPAWEAGPQWPGVFHVPIDLDDRRAGVLLDVVRQTRREVDFLVVSAHWGPNWGRRPQPAHRPLAHALIDAGADLIFGHSCHVVQGVEFYRDRPILYSTGDFIDDYAIDPAEHNDQAFIPTLEIDLAATRAGAGVGAAALSLTPTVIRDLQALLARGPELEAIAARVAALSAEFNRQRNRDLGTA